MTHAQIKAERDYRIAERIAILAGKGPVEEWMRQMAIEDADRWERRREATQVNHGIKTKNTGNV